MPKQVRLHSDQPRAAEQRRRPAPRLSAPQIGVLSFLLAAALGTVLLTLPAASANGKGLAPIDAVFMATSSISNAGLSVLALGSGLSTFGQLVILLLVQTGGLGVVTLGVLIAIATGRRVGVRARLGSNLSHKPMQVGGVVRLLRRVFVYVMAVELVGATVLYLRFLSLGIDNPLYMAVFHAISAFNNSGLSLFPGSLQQFNQDPVVMLCVAAIIVLGGLGFVTTFELLGRMKRTRERRRMTLHTRLVLLFTFGLITFGALAFGALEWNNPATLADLPVADKIVASVFHGISPRSAGFNTVDFTSLHAGTELILMLLMFIGGSPGSLAGGIKTTTLAIVVFSIWQLARGARELHVLGRRIDTSLIMKAAAISSFAILAIGAGTTILTITDFEFETTQLAFEAVSAAATSGLSLGITAGLSTGGKLVISILMFTGRIGLLAFLLAFVQRRDSPMVSYPREDVLVG